MIADFKRVSTGDRINAMAYVLNHTSSNYIRSSIMGASIENQFNESTLRLFGLEAQQFDLATAFIRYSDPKYDDIPVELLNESDDRNVKKYKSELLLKMARYYAVNSGDPVLGVAACRVIEDLKDMRSRKLLRDITKDSQRSIELRTAAKRALEYIDKMEIAPNSVPMPKNLDQVVEWLGDLSRAKREAAILWLENNSVDGDHRPQVIEKLVYLQDDSIYHQRSGKLIRKLAMPQDMVFLRKVIENAIDPAQSNFRTRQDHSLYRIVSLLGHFKDVDGITLCTKLPDPSYDLSKRIAALAKLAEVDLDPVIDDLLKKFDGSGDDRTRFLSLAKYNFTDRQKTKIRNWIVDYINQGHHSSRLWDLLKKCDPFNKKMVPTLIKILVHDHFADRDIRNYLVKYGTSIEQMVISEFNTIKDKKRVSLRLIAFFGDIGTDKSLVILRQYQGGGRQAEAALTAVNKIRQAKRQPKNFDTFPDPNQ